ncbi:MAG: AraC family transcriptional regulator [Verrucomicrobiota bacterium]
MNAQQELVPKQPGISFRTVRECRPTFEHPFHFHPEYELVFIEHSHGRRYVGNSSKPFGPGDLVFMGPNVPHLYFTDKNHSTGPTWARALVLQFLHDAFGKNLFESPELQPVHSFLVHSATGLHFSDPSECSNAADQMRTLLHSDGPERFIGLIRLLHFLSTCRATPLVTSPEPLQLDALQVDRLERAMKVIHQTFREELRLNDVAKAAGLSPEAFCRFLKRATGRSFTTVVNELRIAEVCTLLNDTRRTITDIAFECGFSSYANFHEQFRKLRNCSPHDFRAQLPKRTPVRHSHSPPIPHHPVT